MRERAPREATLPPPAAHVALWVATSLLVGLVAARGVAAPADGDPPGDSGDGAVPASWTLRGGGWGHGVGMSQYGALGMALRDRSAAQIISFYYGGAKVAKTSMPSTVRVGVLQNRADGILLRAGRLPGTAAGGRLQVTASHQVTGMPVVRSFPLGGDLRVVPDGHGLSIVSGRRRVLGPSKPNTVLKVDYRPRSRPARRVPPPPGDGGGVLPPSLPLPPPVAALLPGTIVGAPGRGGDAPDDGGEPEPAGPPVLLTLPQANRTLRWGSLEVGAVRSGSGTRLRAVATMTWTAYLRGLAEVPKSWPVAVQRAQAIAARSYALATVRAAGQHRGASSLSGCDCGVYADTRDQHYLGWAQERGSAAARWIGAVTDTRDEVVLWQGRTLVKAFYSSSNGGHTEGSEVWGGPPQPYYPAKPDEDDRAEGRNPLHDWTVRRSGVAMSAALADLRIGGITGISAVTKDRSGRLRTVLVTGTDGSALVSGLGLQRRLRLRSTLLRTVTATPAPPGPAPPTTAPPPPTEPPPSTGPEPGPPDGSGPPGSGPPGSGPPGGDDGGGAAPPPRRILAAPARRLRLQ
jgi:SpoIID/LytB domain protein